jgi:hypothetical protein
VSLTAPPKGLWASKTIWVNIVGIAGALLGIIPPDENSIVIIGAINLLLRWWTKKPVTLDPQKVPEKP